MVQKLKTMPNFHQQFLLTTTRAWIYHIPPLCMTIPFTGSHAQPSLYILCLSQLRPELLWRAVFTQPACRARHLSIPSTLLAIISNSMHTQIPPLVPHFSDPGRLRHGGQRRKAQWINLPTMIMHTSHQKPHHSMWTTGLTMQDIWTMMA